jgi:site-specific DNA-methyltransferase (adenine-specific)
LDGQSRKGQKKVQLLEKQMTEPRCQITGVHELAEDFLNAGGEMRCILCGATPGDISAVHRAANEAVRFDKEAASLAASFAAEGEICDEAESEIDLEGLFGAPVPDPLAGLFGEPSAATSPQCTPDHCFGPITHTGRIIRGLPPYLKCENCGREFENSSSIPSKAQPFIQAAKSQEWSTPAWLFSMLDKEFNFEIDAMATAGNAKCRKYWTPEMDAFKQDWKGKRIFCNPPWEVETLSKAVEMATNARFTPKTNKKTITVMVVPVKSDQRWWHDCVIGKAQIRFIRGRVKFGNAKNSSTIAVAVLVYALEHWPRVTSLEKPK